MANIVVTSTINYIKVDFGNYFPTYYPIKLAYYNENTIEKVELYIDMVKVHMLGEKGSDWELTYDGSKGLQVDAVDGVAPTSNSDLCDKIGALIKS